MTAVNPLSPEKAADEIKPLLDAVKQNFGKLPNFFALMAYRPAALNNFVPFYRAVMDEGTVEPKLKELAYLKTSILNGCAY